MMVLFGESEWVFILVDGYALRVGADSLNLHILQPRDAAVDSGHSRTSSLCGRSIKPEPVK
jgi:hypothetical protein